MVASDGSNSYSVDASLLESYYQADDPPTDSRNYHPRRVGMLLPSEPIAK